MFLENPCECPQCTLAKKIFAMLKRAFEAPTVDEAIDIAIVEFPQIVDEIFDAPLSFGQVIDTITGTVNALKTECPELAERAQNVLAEFNGVAAEKIIGEVQNRVGARFAALEGKLH